MAYLGDIVRRLEAQQGIKVFGTYDETLKIDYIRFGSARCEGGRLKSADRGVIYIGGGSGSFRR